jgi:hypothetical protein
MGILSKFVSSPYTHTFAAFLIAHYIFNFTGGGMDFVDWVNEKVTFLNGATVPLLVGLCVLVIEMLLGRVAMPSFAWSKRSKYSVNLTGPEVAVIPGGGELASGPDSILLPPTDFFARS